MTTKKKSHLLEMNIFVKDVNGDNRRIGNIPVFSKGKDFDFEIGNKKFKAKPNDNKSEVGKADYYVFVEVKKGYEVWVGSIMFYKVGQGFNILMGEERYSAFPVIEKVKESAA